jgi:alkylation response protein AidB-like acyl-CoA dehydrogenase
MDFATTKEQDKLLADILDFTASQLDSDPADSDRTSEFNRKAWSQCAEFGVLGWPVPDRYGGAGLDPVTCVLAFEALGYGCRDNGLLFAINNSVWATTAYVLNHGSGEQRERFLPRLADGSLVGAHALTEQEAGSDVLSVSTVARRDASRYVLDGVKAFISNAPVADLFVVFAKTDPTAPPQRALSAFLVPRETDGVSIRRSWEKSGLRGSPMGEVVFDSAKLSADHLLGGEGTGYQVFTSTIECERGFMFASQVGTLRRLVETATARAAERRQFGQPINSFQAVSHRLAELRVRLEAARLMLYRFGWLKAQGRLALLESSMLKLHVSESLLAAAIDCVRIYGARGYLTEFGVEREVRDALAGTIYSGTSDIQRSIIAGLMGYDNAG